MAIFCWSWILKDCIKVQEKKRKVIILFVFTSSTTGISRHSSTKKHDTRAELPFCQLKPIAFLPFSLTLPTSLLIISSLLRRILVWHKWVLNCLQNITAAVSRLIESALPEEHEERKKLHEEEMEKLARWSGSNY